MLNDIQEIIQQQSDKDTETQVTALTPHQTKVKLSDTIFLPFYSLKQRPIQRIKANITCMDNLKNFGTFVKQKKQSDLDQKSHKQTIQPLSKPVQHC